MTMRPPSGKQLKSKTVFAYEKYRIIKYANPKDNEYDSEGKHKYIMKINNNPIKTTVIGMKGILAYLKKYCEYNVYLRIEQFFMDIRS